MPAWSARAASCATPESDLGEDFDIPFHRISVVEPQGRKRSRVVLHNGEELTLENGADVSRDNSGVLVFRDDDDNDPRYFRWGPVPQPF